MTDEQQGPVDHEEVPAEPVAAPVESAATEVDTTTPAMPAATVPTPGVAGWFEDPDGGRADLLRYWDGQSWTEHRHDQSQQQETSMTGGFSTTRVDEDERRAILARQIQSAAARGLRVETQDRYQAIMVEGRPINHTLHAILTVFTCLLWGIVWAVIAATGGETRYMISVDEYGNVTNQKLGKS